ncbi:MAG TPA: transporter substrate-binding domain-containing protein [Actinomycetota bacterium]|nr:transporter substrate-binding domain-containing protein [Actinomycetota bacterium]
MRLPLRLRAVALALAAAACVPPIPDNDELVSFDEVTVMGEIQGAGTLVVGLPDDVGDPWVGFATAVARDIGESLGVDLEFQSHPNEDLVGLVDAGSIDVGFPVLTITEQLVRKHAFSDPIYVGHQRLVVPADAGVETVEDLTGEVCSPVDDATGVELHELEPSLSTVPLRPGNAEGCVPLLEDGLVSSATAPDVLLATIMSELPDGYEVTGEQLTTEPLAVALERGASGWVDYVNKVITEFDQEGRWAAAYEEHLGTHLGGPTPEPPNMTLEEAAALFPADLAEI